MWIPDDLLEFWHLYVRTGFGTQPIAWPDHCCPATLCDIAAAHTHCVEDIRREWVCQPSAEAANAKFLEKYGSFSKGLMTLLDAHGFERVPQVSDPHNKRNPLPMDVLIYSGVFTHERAAGSSAHRLGGRPCCSEIPKAADGWSGGKKVSKPRIRTGWKAVRTCITGRS